MMTFRRYVEFKYLCYANNRISVLRVHTIQHNYRFIIIYIIHYHSFEQIYIAYSPGLQVPCLHYIIYIVGKFIINIVDILVGRNKTIYIDFIFITKSFEKINNNIIIVLNYFQNNCKSFLKNNILFCLEYLYYVTIISFNH